MELPPTADFGRSVAANKGPLLLGIVLAGSGKRPAARRSGCFLLPGGGASEFGGTDVVEGGAVVDCSGNEVVGEPTGRAKDVDGALVKE